MITLAREVVAAKVLTARSLLLARTPGCFPLGRTTCAVRFGLSGFCSFKGKERKKEIADEHRVSRRT